MLRNQECGSSPRTILAAAMFAVVAGFVGELPAAAQDVRPFVECVKAERRGQTLFIAYFGYTNPGTEPVTLPAGTVQNYMLPSPADKGQLSVFEPGEHRFVFSLAFPINSQLAWTVNGNRAVASDSLMCPSYLVYQGEWQPGTTYSDGDVLEFNDRYYQAISRQPPPPGSLARPFVDFAGTPEDSGAPWHIVNPSTYPVLNLPGSGGNVHLSTNVYVFPRNGRLTITDSRITPDSVVQVAYVGGNLLPGVAVEIAAGRFTAIGLPGKKFRYVLIN